MYSRSSCEKSSNGFNLFQVRMTSISSRAIHPPPLSSSSYMPTTSFDGSPCDTSMNDGSDMTSGCTIWQRLFHRHDFRRPAIERLYAVYAYRSRLADVRCLAALFIVLFLSLAVVDFAFAYRPSVDSVTHVALAAAASVALVVLYTRLTTRSRLPAVALFIVGVALVFAAVAMLPVARRTSRAPAEGVWRLCFASFLIYALAPLRLYVALLYGLIVCAAHGLLAVATASDMHPGLLWRQVNFTIHWMNTVFSITSRSTNRTTLTTVSGLTSLGLSNDVNWFLSIEVCCVFTFLCSGPPATPHAHDTASQY